MYIYADLNEFMCRLDEQYLKKVSRKGGGGYGEEGT